MKFSFNLLKNFVEIKMKPRELAEVLTARSFETTAAKAGNDWILEADILPNRAHDCLSYLGLAREIAAVAGGKLKEPEFSLKEDKRLKTSDFVSVGVENRYLCPRYVCRAVDGVKVGPSPKWLKNWLEANGQKPINNIVDAANYVMFATGQPLHAFDFEKIGGGKKKEIIVRQAKRGESIITLDEQAFLLDESALVIADGKEPLAIAGIKGGKKAEIGKKTKTIILESANFDFSGIRKTSRKIGLKTDASIRFAAGLDPNLAGEAIDFLAALIAEIAMPGGKQAGGKIAKGKIDFYPRPLAPVKIALRKEEIAAVLGVEISEKEIIKILKSIGCEVQKISFKGESVRPKLVKLAKSLLGRPYQWGVKTVEAPANFDCSSFTKYLYRQMGVEIPRISVEQFLAGRPVEKSELKPGDLVYSKGRKPYYYKETPEGVGHCGIYAGGGKVVHASGKEGKVVLQTLSVFEKEWRGARRFLPDNGPEAILAEVPTSRLNDIYFKEDLIEEIGRIYGYEKIAPKPISGELVLPKENEALRWESAAKDALVGAGFSEVLNYSFVGKAALKNFGIGEKISVPLRNPVSATKEFLAPSLVLNLLQNAADNFRFFEEARIFEINKVFRRDSSAALDAAGGGISERKSLAILESKKNPKYKNEEFYHLKGTVDLLFERLGINDLWYDTAPSEGEAEKFWHPARLAEIKVGEKKLGMMGEIKPEILKSAGAKESAALCVIDFESLAELATEEREYVPPAKFPAVIRDIAVVVPAGTMIEDAQGAIETAGGDLVFDSDLFDVYEGAGLPAEKISFAFHIIFQSPAKTLTDEEVDKIYEKITKAVEGRGWEIRK